MKLEKLKLDLNVEWKISRNSTNFKENYILSHKEHQSEVAPNIRYGETPEHIEKSFSDFLNSTDFTLYLVSCTTWAKSKCTVNYFVPMNS